MNGPQNDREAPQGASQATSIAQMMEGQWSNMLRTVTAQGGTRADIQGLTLTTAKVMLNLTSRALWPDLTDEGLDANVYGNQEVAVAASFILATEHLQAGLAALEE